MKPKSLAATVRPSPVIRTRQDLAGLRVGIPLGDKTLAQFVRGLPNAIQTPDVVTGFKMLDAGRLDVVITVASTLSLFTKAAGLKSSTAPRPPLFAVPLVPGARLRFGSW